jgi:hypothetical protein
MNVQKLSIVAYKVSYYELIEVIAILGYLKVVLYKTVKHGTVKNNQF